MRRPSHTQQHDDRSPDQPDRDCRCRADHAVFFGGIMIVTALLGVLLIVRFDWSYALSNRLHWADLVDFAAPTAQQAREVGWVGMVERLAP